MTRAQPVQPEWRLQIQLCDYLKLCHPELLWWSTPNGGYIMDRRVVAKLKATGLRPGVSDLILIGPQGRAIGIEVKVPGAYPSPEQRAFRDALFAAGGRYFIVRSIDDLRQVLSDLGIHGRERAA